MGQRHMRLWLVLGAFLMTVAAGGMVAAQGQSQDQGQDQGQDRQAETPAADPATDDAAYLSQLGLVRGHMRVGVALYMEQARDAARTHMKHPQDELYATLLPAFEARGVKGFGPELKRLAELTAADAPDGQVQTAYDDLVTAITETERQGAPQAFADPPTLVRVAAQLLRTAAEEYDEATDNRRVVMAHEYQDAWGFAETAQLLIDRVRDDIHHRSPQTLETIRDQFKAISVAWTGVVPPETVNAEPALLDGAAAQLEQAALALE